MSLLKVKNSRFQESQQHSKTNKYFHSQPVLSSGCQRVGHSSSVQSRCEDYSISKTQNIQISPSNKLLPEKSRLSKIFHYAEGCSNLQGNKNIQQSNQMDETASRDRNQAYAQQQFHKPMSKKAIQNHEQESDFIEFKNKFQYQRSNQEKICKNSSYCSQESYRQQDFIPYPPDHEWPYFDQGYPNYIPVMPPWQIQYLDDEKNCKELDRDKIYEQKLNQEPFYKFPIYQQQNYNVVNNKNIQKDPLNSIKIKNLKNQIKRLKIEFKRQQWQNLLFLIQMILLKKDEGVSKLWDFMDGFPATQKVKKGQIIFEILALLECQNIFEDLKAKQIQKKYQKKQNISKTKKLLKKLSRQMQI